VLLQDIVIADSVQPPMALLGQVRQQNTLVNPFETVGIPESPQQPSNKVYAHSQSQS
jgi:hypothetical protein